MSIMQITVAVTVFQTSLLLKAPYVFDHVLVVHEFSQLNIHSNKKKQLLSFGWDIQKINF